MSKHSSVSNVAHAGTENNSSSLELFQGQLTLAECLKPKFKKNPKFHLVKYRKTIGTIQKYCQRGSTVDTTCLHNN